MPNNRKNSVKSLINYAKKVGKNIAKFEQKTFADSGQKDVQKKQIQVMAHELAARQLKLELYIEQLEQQGAGTKNMAVRPDQSEQALQRENAELKANLRQKDQEIAQLKADLQKIFDDYGRVSDQWRDNPQRKYQFGGAQAALGIISLENAVSGNTNNKIVRLTLDVLRRLHKAA